MICMVDVTGGCIRLSVHHCCLLHDVEASRMRFPPLIPPLAGPERSEKMVVCARLAQFLAGRPSLIFILAQTLVPGAKARKEEPA